MRKTAFRRMRNTVIGIIMVVLLFTVVQTPTQVAASTSTFSEDFDDTNFLDASTTTATGWGYDEIRIPFKKATFVDNCSVTSLASNLPSVYGDYLFLPIGTHGVDVVDISDPTDPLFVTLIGAARPRFMAAQGNYGYLCDDIGLRILNITDIENSIEVATYNPGPARHFVIDGSYGYLSTYGDGIHVLDISNPLAPVSVFNYTHVNATYVYQTQKVGDFLFALEFGAVASDFGVQIINATDPTNITFMSRCVTPAPYWGVQMQVSGDYIYVFSNGILSIISKATSLWTPELIAEVTICANLIGDMSVSGGYFYFATAVSGLQMLDVTNPLAPRLDFISITGAEPRLSWIVVRGNYVYTTGKNGGYTVEVYELSDALTATAQSLPVHQIDSGVMITEAILTADDTVPSSTSIDYYLSADNGTTWEQVNSGVNHVFTEMGRNLLWKGILDTDTATVTPEIYSVDLSMKIQRVPPEITRISFARIYNRPVFYLDADDASIILHLDTVQSFDSANFRNYTGTYFGGALSGYGVSVFINLENGTWYYRVAGIDDDGDIGLWSEVGTLQIGTTSTTLLPPELILILVIGGAIGVVVVLVVIMQRRKGI